MRVFLLTLMAAVVGCVPPLVDRSALVPSEVELRASNSPVWIAGLEALGILSSALKNFDPAMGEVRSREAAVNTVTRRVYEFNAPRLEESRVLVLLVFQGSRVFLVLRDLNTAGEASAANPVLERLSGALRKAMDDNFERGSL